MPGRKRLARTQRSAFLPQHMVNQILVIRFCNLSIDSISTAPAVRSPGLGDDDRHVRVPEALHGRDGGGVQQIPVLQFGSVVVSPGALEREQSIVDVNNGRLIHIGKERVHVQHEHGVRPRQEALEICDHGDGVGREGALRGRKTPDVERMAGGDFDSAAQSKFLQREVQCLHRWHELCHVVAAVEQPLVSHSNDGDAVFEVHNIVLHSCVREGLTVGYVDHLFVGHLHHELDSGVFDGCENGAVGVVDLGVLEAATFEKRHRFGGAWQVVAQAAIVDSYER